MRILLLSLLFFVLLGCSTAKLGHQNIIWNTEGCQTWLEPIAQPGQVIIKERGVIVAWSKGKLLGFGIGLKCGICTNGAETLVIYKIENMTMKQLDLSSIKITLTDAEGNSLSASPNNRRTEAPDLPAGLVVMGSEIFIGSLSKFPITVSWNFTNGRVITFIFAEMGEARARVGWAELVKPNMNGGQ